MATVTLNFGSSPRTRGTDQQKATQQLHRRFIPAHAGNRVACISPPICLPVHPRARGEQAVARKAALTSAGSSPHVRGTVLGQAARRDDRRFIPARAGNSDPGNKIDATWAVHPRTCGEQKVLYRLCDRFAGSSPHVRGTACLISLHFLSSRFIPARAGNRMQGSGTINGHAVHPRTCGEQLNMELLILT